MDLSKKEGKEELRKDISALANSCGDGRGLLLFGFKDGEIFDAPIPLDEATVQQIICSAISPAPHVSIFTGVVNSCGKSCTLTLLEVGPPFDRPYVTKAEAMNLVFVRRGSSTTTSTRYELDSLYEQKVRTPAIDLELSSRHGYHDILYSTGTAELILPGPRIRLDDIRSELSARVVKYREESRSNSYPSDEQIYEFEGKIQEFLESLENRDNLLYWSSKRLVSPTLRIGASVRNLGSLPATEVRIELELPPWLSASSAVPEKAPNTYVPEPTIPLQQTIPRSRAQVRPSSSFALGDHMSVYDSHIRHMIASSAPPAVKEAKASKDGSRLMFWYKRMLHDSAPSTLEGVSVLVLPTCPMEEERIQAKIRIFCEQMTTWQNYAIELIIGSNDSMLDT